MSRYRRSCIKEDVSHMAKNKVLNLSTTDRLTPQHLLLLDAAEAEKTFNTLALNQKVKLVLAAPWQKRRAIIMMAENARELLQAIPCDELYWTIRQYGVEDSLQLISLTSQEQLQFFFDMDCWRKDSLDSSAISQWYTLLSKCHELKVMEWFHDADEQFLVASLKRLMRVRKIQQDTDISEEYEDMPAATLDGIYFFIFIEKDAYTTVMPLLNTLYLNDRDLFYSLAEGIIWDTGPEVEEAAYAWKKNRLAEYGFPDFEESLAVYQPLSDKELHDLSVAFSGKGQGRRPEEKAMQPRYSLSGDDMPQFYVSALSMLEDVETYERVQRETIILANKILIADSLEVQSAEDTRRALRKAAGAINIALETLSNSDTAAASTLISHEPAATIFRAGISLIMKTRKDFNNFGWHIQDRSLLLSFFGPPYGETLRGLSGRRPLLYEGIVKSGATEYRAFMTRDELSAAHNALRTCTKLDTLLFIRLSIDPAWLFSDFLLTTSCEEPGQLTVPAVLLTMLARLSLSGEGRLEALSETEGLTFIKKVFTKSSAGSYALKTSFCQAGQAWLQEAFAGEVPDVLEQYLQQLLLKFEDTFSSLVNKKTIEKRYIDKLLFKKK